MHTFSKLNIRSSKLMLIPISSLRGKRSEKWRALWDTFTAVGEIHSRLLLGVCKMLLSCPSRFAERTSMQGVPYINTSSTVVGKLLWVSILLICFVLLSGHLYYLCSIYYSYPKHSTVELGFSALPFPAVTFCNANPVRRSHLFLTSKELRMLVSKTDTEEVIKKIVRLTFYVFILFTLADFINCVFMWVC